MWVVLLSGREICSLLFSEFYKSGEEPVEAILLTSSIIGFLQSRIKDISMFFAISPRLHTFTAEKVQAVPVVFPPPQEQTAIAVYLDKQT